MLEPYQKGKIPVVFVHGLDSNPMTWMKMINDLRADPELQSRYQFWFFQYPTGMPIMYSAYSLRSCLNSMREYFQDTYHDPALDDMVLIGHSMGGVLSRLMVQSSGDTLQKIVIGDKTFDQLSLKESTKNLLKDIIVFEPVPGVKHAIFIAAPHRGSAMATGFFGKLFASMIKLPLTMTQSINEMASQQVFFKAVGKGKLNMPTGVGALSPDSPGLVSTVNLPISKEVKYHTIIGNVNENTGKPGTDGVVANTSSHLDGAESEFVVNSGHSCLSHPLVILEVKRILQEHLESVPLEDKVPAQ